ncbi:peptidoglycan recognition family protein [Streptomyces sp. B1I3]|uniref:peptidoglycan recognition protein family protein n=1 Tax=Streptomyces sp. B1I3 TaxID=3042264 RepID=UPI002785A225|nr:peptidoglycan recognition family protein [Streptomyces sp. B1I3]MDQ0795566.1 hypothetical protein [Streptomyces sp. B1I3]
MAAPLSPDRLLAALRAEGVTVVEHKSWRTHERPASTGSFGPINGVMLHHTVTSGTSGSVALCYTGHSQLPGPLCHGVIDKDGTVYLVSAGRANHAGRGDDDVLRQVQDESYDRDKLLTPNEANTDGNTRFYGFECVNLGDGRDPWPPVQRDAMVRVSAAILRAYGGPGQGWTARSVIGHKEWQPGKVDPRTGTGGVDVSPPVVRRLVDERLAHPANWTAGTSAPTPPKENEDMTEAQMAKLADLVVDRLLAADKFDAPADAADYSADKKNPRHYWSGRSVFSDLVTRVRHIDKTLTALAKKLEA